MTPSVPAMVRWVFSFRMPAWLSRACVCVRVHTIRINVSVFDGPLIRGPASAIERGWHVCVTGREFLRTFLTVLSGGFVVFRFSFRQSSGQLLTIVLDEQNGKHRVRYRDGEHTTSVHGVSREDVISMLETVMLERLLPVGRSPLLAPDFPADVFARLAHI